MYNFCFFLTRFKEIILSSYIRLILCILVDFDYIVFWLILIILYLGNEREIRRQRLEMFGLQKWIFRKSIINIAFIFKFVNIGFIFLLIR